MGKQKTDGIFDRAEPGFVVCLHPVSGKMWTMFIYKDGTVVTPAQFDACHIPKYHVKKIIEDWYYLPKMKIVRKWNKDILEYKCESDSQPD